MVGDIVDIVAFGTFELSNFSKVMQTLVDHMTGLANDQFLQYNSTSGNFELYDYCYGCIRG